jgi:hypothetical protein
MKGNNSNGEATYPRCKRSFEVTKRTKKVCLREREREREIGGAIPMLGHMEYT